MSLNSIGGTRFLTSFSSQSKDKRELWRFSEKKKGERAGGKRSSPQKMRVKSLRKGARFPLTRGSPYIRVNRKSWSNRVLGLPRLLTPIPSEDCLGNPPEIGLYPLSPNPFQAIPTGRTSFHLLVSFQFVQRWKTSWGGGAHFYLVSICAC